MMIFSGFLIFERILDYLALFSQQSTTLIIMQVGIDIKLNI